MITCPTEFEAQRRNTTSKANMVVVIQVGSVLYGFSEASGQLTHNTVALEVRPLLVGVSGLKRTLDVFTKKWNVASVKVTLANEPFRRDTAGTAHDFDMSVRISELLVDVKFAPVAIYLVNSDEVTDVYTDSLRIFTGYVSARPKYNRQRLELMVIERSYTEEKMLPLHRMGDVFTDTPDEYADQLVPLAYGDFDFDLDNTSAKGLAIAVPTNADGMPVFVVSDHAMDTITDVYTVDPQLTDPVRYTTLTADVDSGGYGVYTATAEVEGYVYPVDPLVDGLTKSDADWGTWADAEPIANFQNAVDHNDSTYAVLYDNVQDDSASQVEGLAMFHIVEWPSYEKPTYCHIQFKTTDPAGDTGTPDTYSVFGSVTGDTVKSGPPLFPSRDDGTTWQTSPADMLTYWDPEDGDPLPEFFAIYRLNTGSNWTPDGILNNSAMLNIHDVRLKMKYPTVAIDGYKTVGYVAGSGRTYGTWINSRSSEYSSGDVITDGAGVIEDILRSELGMTSADIDLASFIEAENTSMPMHLNLHSGNKAIPSTLFRKIAEQSTFAFLWSLAGKARLVNLDAEPASVDRTIKYAHIVDGNVEVEDTEFLVNKLIVASRYWQEYQDYRDNAVIENSTSQTDYGTWEYEAKWDLLWGAAVTYLAGHLVSDSDGIWSHLHDVISFSTVGHIHADVEVGDWVELESTELDFHLLMRASSWSGKKLLVVSREIKRTHMQFKALALY